jgi:arylsulfatase A-like enzyme
MTPRQTYEAAVRFLHPGLRGVSALVMAAASISWSTGPALAGDSAETPPRPNIVLILADDIGYSDYGCYGGEIATPNIDRLAREGLQFTQFYNNAVCVPTRASVMTGLFPRHAPGIRITDQMTTVAEVLGSAGYRSTLSGKWHLGNQKPNRPIDRGFVEYYGLADGCCNYHDPAIKDPPFEGGDGVRDWMHNGEFIRQFPEGFYSTDAIADHAIAQIRQAAAEKKPFFTHVCFTAAHSPLHAKPADIAKYQGKYSEGWDVIRERRRLRQIELGLADSTWAIPPREREVKPWSEEPLRPWKESLMETYAAMVDSMDQNIGRILSALDETGTADRTIVIVLNDNGGCAEQAGGDDPTNIPGPKEHYVSCGPGWAYVQNTPFRRYKAWVHEGGISTPCMVRWPGVVRPGTRSAEVGHVIDLLPTLAEIGGAEIPTERSNGKPLLKPEGRSLAPVLRGQKPAERGTLYWASLDNRAIRRGDMKLVWDQNVRRWELYDLSKDRTEMNDLAATKSDLAAELAADWTKWADETGAVRNLGRGYDIGKRNPPPRK